MKVLILIFLLWPSISFGYVVDKGPDTLKDYVDAVLTKEEVIESDKNLFMEYIHNLIDKIRADNQRRERNNNGTSIFHYQER